MYVNARISFRPPHSLAPSLNISLIVRKQTQACSDPPAHTAARWLSATRGDNSATQKHTSKKRNTAKDGAHPSSITYTPSRRLQMHTR